MLFKNKNSKKNQLDENQSVPTSSKIEPSNIENKTKKKVLEKETFFQTLTTYEIGIIKNYGEKDFITERKKSYGFILTLSFEDLYLHKKDLQDKSTKKDDIVIFKYGKNEKGKVAKNIITLKVNQVSLKSLIYFIDKFYKSNSSFFQSKQISKLIQAFISNGFIKNIDENVYLKLLAIYNGQDKLNLIDNYITINEKITNNLIVILEKSLNNGSIEQFLKLKNKDTFLNYTQIKNKLEKIPKYIEFKYADFLNDIKKCQNYSHIEVSYEPNDIYNLFEDSDYILAKKWISQTNNFQYEYSKMISARGAEIASKKFYALLGCNVCDTAITQLNNNNDNWKFFDLHVDTKNIDVKNSRGVLNEKLSYSEHCIPRFKETRDGEHIYILGVISLYFKLGDDEERLKHNAFYSTTNIENMITILGETSLDEINRYSSRFSQKELQVDLSRVNFTPDWVLEYPKEFYTQRDNLKNKFLKEHTQYPTSNEYKQLNQNLIPFFLSCGLDLPCSELNKEQVNFYNRLKVQGKQSITKPFLYLAILKHFSERLKHNANSSYRPIDYRQLIYYEASYKYPLGIYDPTLIIKKLIDTLETLWQQKNSIDMSNYVTFKYNQKGILLAKSSMSSSWDTLLAYCGGFIEGKGSCGFKPLIKGEHETCAYCNKIICPECSFCRDGCNRLKNQEYF